jgi:hypothetical protein
MDPITLVVIVALSLFTALIVTQMTNNRAAKPRRSEVPVEIIRRRNRR